jgi:hypothetical protein
MMFFAAFLQLIDQQALPLPEASFLCLGIEGQNDRCFFASHSNPAAILIPVFDEVE